MPASTTAYHLPDLKDVLRSAKAELLDVANETRLSPQSLEEIFKALSGRSRILPEGKATLCSAMTFWSYVSASRGQSVHAVPAMAAMEFLMAAGDLIDDIEDGEAELDGSRHSLGRVLRTVSLLLMLSHTAIGRAHTEARMSFRIVGAFQVLDDMGVDALMGQELDMSLERESRVSIEQSISMSRLKSASLLKCAAELGACLGTDDEEEIELHARFGWHVGLMAQLMNDIAAIWPGASSKTDIRLRKKTLPIAFALNVPGSRSEHARLVQHYYDGTGTDGVAEDKVKWALWRCGAVHFTWMVAAAEKAKAERIARDLSHRARGHCHLGELL